jgi:hypothetical protein
VEDKVKEATMDFLEEELAELVVKNKVATVDMVIKVVIKNMVATAIIKRKQLNEILFYLLYFIASA